VEVVCGVTYDQLTFTEGQMADFRGLLGPGYPKLSFQQPLRDEFTMLVFRLGVPLYEQRWWMETEDGEWLVQLQQDKFLLNWRQPKDGEYPHFSADGGVLECFMKHWHTLQAFVRQRMDREVVAKRVEVTKVNHIRRGLHWDNVEELCELVPFVRGLHGLVGQELLMDMTLVDAQHPTNILSARIIQDDVSEQALRLELTRRYILREGEELYDQFIKQNEQLNEQFYRLITSTKLERFMDGVL
jgi:uncharacterized protein (TIGR04255 family)